MYFDYNESGIHKQAKEKLFDLIKSRRVNITDDKGNAYDIFKGKYENEFLHMESFVMGYTNDVLFSSKNSPCKISKMNINKPLCDQKGYYGAFEKLPCEECILKNIGKNTLDSSSKYASYRPDISFGYEGKHKIWLEIKYKNPCSINKIEFCSSNNIILLEIDADIINKFNSFNGNLPFKNLNVDMTADLDCNSIKKYINYRLKKYQYVLVTELKGKINENFTINQWKKIYELATKDLIEIEKYNNGLKEHLKLKSIKKILVHKNKMDEYIKIQNDYDNKINKTINELTKNAVKEVNKNGYILFSTFKNKTFGLAPTGHKTKFNYDQIFKDNNIMKVKYGDYPNELNKLGIGKGSNNRFILLTRKNYNKYIGR